eukprot:1036981-Pyramimonas_sp.AAC.2
MYSHVYSFINAQRRNASLVRIAHQVGAPAQAPVGWRRLTTYPSPIAPGRDFFVRKHSRA